MTDLLHTLNAIDQKLAAWLLIFATVANFTLCATLYFIVEVICTAARSRSAYNHTIRLKMEKPQKTEDDAR